MRAYIVIALIGCTSGILLVYFAAALSALVGAQSELLGSIIFLAITLVGFAMILLGLAPFMQVYLSERLKRKK